MPEASAYALVFLLLSPFHLLLPLVFLSFSAGIQTLQFFSCASSKWSPAFHWSYAKTSNCPSLISVSTNSWHSAWPPLAPSTFFESSLTLLIDIFQSTLSVQRWSFDSLPSACLKGSMAVYSHWSWPWGLSWFFSLSFNPLPGKCYRFRRPTGLLSIYFYALSYSKPSHAYPDSLLSCSFHSRSFVKYKLD